MAYPCNLSPFLQFLHVWKSKITFSIECRKNRSQSYNSQSEDGGKRGGGGGEMTQRMTQRDSVSTKSKQAKHLGVGEQKLSKRDWFKF